MLIGSPNNIINDKYIIVKPIHVAIEYSAAQIILEIIFEIIKLSVLFGKDKVKYPSSVNILLYIDLIKLLTNRAAEAIIDPPIKSIKLAYSIVINIVGSFASLTIKIKIDKTKNDAIIKI
jgi:hypothetical protein